MIRLTDIKWKGQTCIRYAKKIKIKSRENSIKFHGLVAFWTTGSTTFQYFQKDGTAKDATHQDCKWNIEPYQSN